MNDTTFFPTCCKTRMNRMRIESTVNINEEEYSDILMRDKDELLLHKMKL